MLARRKTNAPCTCTSAGRVTAQLLLSFLAVGAAVQVQARTADSDNRADSQFVLPIENSSPSIPLQPEPPSPADHVFTLRHVYHHGTYRHPGLHRKLDVAHRDTQVWLAAEDGYEQEQVPKLRAKSNALRIQRLVDRRPSVVDPIVALGRERGYVSVMAPEAWTVDDIPGPNVTDKDTVVSLAYMASDAYVEMPGHADWEDIGGPFNRSADFGWAGDGLRGHVWADETNSTIVVGLKGTSPAVFDGDGTTTNDKENDNLFFSCCCAQQGPWTWHQVCDCATGTYTCNTTCVVQALRDENRYYQAARELFANVTELYPDSNVWLTGHSLGGAVSSLLGLTYGVPAVTFQAVPEALPASRLGLPVPPGSDPGAPQSREHTGVFHFGHTADPIYLGTCNGATASCSFGGYAMESACHTGQECVYDTVGDKGWRVGIGTHKIRAVIRDVLLKYDTVPECHFTPECRDCGSWKMYESNGTETTTSSRTTSTTKTRTRTETCKTPGWWGCLDETATTTATTTSEPTTTTTTTTTSTTCLTPGWFGCKDKTTITTTTTTTAQPVTTTAAVTKSSSLPSSPTTTCETPGRLWGCRDKTTTATTTTIAPSAHPITSAPAVPSDTSTSAPGASPTEGPDKKSKCLAQSWLGYCKEWAPSEGESVRDEM